ncbi:MAG: SpoIID/LytB domain-containing protein [Deltaproteobacteria bacterium]|nr:SpoIID/LytB domain-containing protein [Deltaproteobacteria bacterium]
MKRFVTTLSILFLCLPSVAWSMTVQFDPAPLKAAAARYLDEGRFLECVETYRQVFEYSARPEDRAFGLVRMGDVVALFLDQKEKALEIYSEAVALFPEAKALDNAYFNSGMAAYELGRLSEAERGFEAYLRFFPDGHRAFTAEYMIERVREEVRQADPGPAVVKKPEEVLQPLLEPRPEPQPTAGPEPNIRVALDSGSSVRLTLEGPASVRFGAQGQEWAAGEYVFTLKNGRIQSGGRDLGRECAVAPRVCCFSVKGKRYAGEAVVLVDDGKVLLINRLGMETYLLGVVPKEMSPSWELEALKSQAVAARSYALYLAAKSADKPYDVAATTASQVYGGAGVANDRTKQAVSSTRGEILSFSGNPVLSYFHAHSGGMLEDSSLVWTASMPYYQVREDSISQTFKPMDWDARISKGEVAKALRTNGFKVSSISKIFPEEVSPSGRWVKVKVMTDGGPLSVRSNSLRIWLGATKVKSTLCDVRESGDSFVLSGRGYGHGVGMSQWGAQGMAKAGGDYRKVLHHYYPGTSIARAY